MMAFIHLRWTVQMIVYFVLCIWVSSKWAVMLFWLCQWTRHLLVEPCLFKRQLFCVKVSMASMRHCGILCWSLVLPGLSSFISYLSRSSWNLLQFLHIVFHFLTNVHDYGQCVEGITGALAVYSWLQSQFHEPSGLCQVLFAYMATATWVKTCSQLLRAVLASALWQE